MLRFISIDPWVGTHRFPASHNAYSYAANNPFRYRDPMGTVIKRGLNFSINLSAPDVPDLPIDVLRQIHEEKRQASAAALEHYRRLIEPYRGVPVRDQPPEVGQALNAAIDANREWQEAERSLRRAEAAQTASQVAEPSPAGSGGSGQPNSNPLEELSVDDSSSLDRPPSGDAFVDDSPSSSGYQNRKRPTTNPDSPTRPVNVQPDSPTIERGTNRPRSGPSPGTPPDSSPGTVESSPSGALEAEVSSSGSLEASSAGASAPRVPPRGGVKPTFEMSNVDEIVPSAPSPSWQRGAGVEPPFRMRTIDEITQSASRRPYGVSNTGPWMEGGGGVGGGLGEMAGAAAGRLGRLGGAVAEGAVAHLIFSAIIARLSSDDFTGREFYDKFYEEVMSPMRLREDLVNLSQIESRISAAEKQLLKVFNEQANPKGEFGKFEVIPDVQRTPDANGYREVPVELPTDIDGNEIATWRDLDRNRDRLPPGLQNLLNVIRNNVYSGRPPLTGIVRLRPKPVKQKGPRQEPAKPTGFVDSIATAKSELDQRDEVARGLYLEADRVHRALADAETELNKVEARGEPDPADFAALKQAVEKLRKRIQEIKEKQERRQKQLQAIAQDIYKSSQEICDFATKVALEKRAREDPNIIPITSEQKRKMAQRATDERKRFSEQADPLLKELQLPIPELRSQMQDVARLKRKVEPFAAKQGDEAGDSLASIRASLHNAEEAMDPKQAAERYLKVLKHQKTAWGLLLPWSRTPQATELLDRALRGPPKPDGLLPENLRPAQSFEELQKRLAKLEELKAKLPDDAGEIVNEANATYDDPTGAGGTPIEFIISETCCAPPGSPVRRRSEL